MKINKNLRNVTMSFSFIQSSNDILSPDIYILVLFKLTRTFHSLDQIKFETPQDFREC